VILVDSSVWISLLRGQQSPNCAALVRILNDGDAAIVPVVLQELLGGARSESSLQRLQDRLGALPMLMVSTATHASAGALYARCRWQGITPRSPRDCLIAWSAIEHDVPVLQQDADFRRIQRVEQRLKLLAVPGPEGAMQ